MWVCTVELSVNATATDGIDLRTTISDQHKLASSWLIQKLVLLGDHLKIGLLFHRLESHCTVDPRPQARQFLVWIQCRLMPAWFSCLRLWKLALRFRTSSKLALHLDWCKKRKTLEPNLLPIIRPSLPWLYVWEYKHTIPLSKPSSSQLWFQNCSKHNGYVYPGGG